MEYPHSAQRRCYQWICEHLSNQEFTIEDLHPAVGMATYAENNLRASRFLSGLSQIKAIQLTGKAKSVAGQRIGRYRLTPDFIYPATKNTQAPKPAKQALSAYQKYKADMDQREADQRAAYDALENALQAIRPWHVPPPALCQPARVITQGVWG